MALVAKARTCGLLLLAFAVALPLRSGVNRQSTPGKIVPLGNMNVARSGHTATLLRDGTVLMAGGMLRNGDFTATAETYDSQTNRFTPTNDMLLGRVGAAATLLPSGKVLVVGGWQVTDEAEIYDPATRSFALAGKMTQRRARPTATLLKDGSVLITGGETDSSTLAATASAEVYDERSAKFAAVGAMHVARSAHTATLLQDGRVLVVGGSFGRGKVTETAEVYDPASRSFKPVGNLSVPRYKHSACLLPDGRVMVAGGSDSRDWNGAYDSAELFDPKTSRFSSASKMADARFKLPPEAAETANEVVVFGGAAGAAVYDERSNTFQNVPRPLDTERFYPSSTTLKDGRVLLAGGYPRHPPYDATRSAWLYVPGAQAGGSQRK